MSGMFNMLISSAPTYQGGSVLFAALESEFGWSRAVIAGVASFGRFGGAMFGPLEGWIADRFGSSKVVLIGFILAGIGLILFARINSISTYYAAYFLLSIGFSIGGFTPSMAAVNAWMPHRRSTAMALVIGGSSLAGFTVPAIVWGIQKYGWRDTVTIIGIVTLISGPFLAWVLSKRIPSRSELDERIRLATKNSTKSTVWRLGYDFSPKQALKTKAFWAISTGHMLTNLSVGTISAHIFLHLTDKDGVGLNDAIAGTVMVVCVFISFSFQLIGGWLGDRMDKRYLTSVLVLVQGFSLLILAMADNFVMAIIFAVIWGIGFGARTPLTHAMRGEYFGRKHFATILGMSGLPMAIGMMGAPVIIGWIHDIQGTYVWAFYVLALSCLAGSVIFLFASKPKAPN